MYLENILPLMREGKKAINKILDKDGEYWVLGYSGLREDIFGKRPDEEKFLTMVRLNKKDKWINDKFSWGIARWAVVDDQWEILEDKE